MRMTFSTQRILVHELSRSFGAVAAVSDVSFAVAAGEVCGLVGPNGAGKSTLLGMLSGLVRIDHGYAAIDGVAVGRTRGSGLAVGVLPEVAELVEDISGVRLVTHVGILRGLPPREAKSRAAVLAEYLDLPHPSMAIGDYSTGNRKKTGLACALVVKSSVLLLDEPLEAVDPISASRITGLLQQHCAAGGAVLLSTHDLRLVADVCSRVLVMSKGHLVHERRTDGGPDHAGLLADLQALAEEPLNPVPGWLQ